MCKYMKKIFIHIGTPKTGTTAIQKFLSENYKKLLNAGYYYPIVGRGYRNNTRNISNPEIWMNGTVLKDLSSFKALLKKFDTLKSKNLILSDECLFMKGSNDWYGEDIKKLLNNYEIKLIVYLRPAPDYLCGLWQESVKYRYTLTLEESIAKSNYYEELHTLKNLMCMIKRENVLIRIYDKKKLFKHNSVYDFAQSIKLVSPEKYIISSDKINTSLDRVSANKILFFNKIARLPPDDNSKLYKYITDSSNKGVSVLNSMPKKLHSSINKKYADIEEEITSKFFRGEKLFEDSDYTYVSVSDELDILFRLKATLVACLFRFKATQVAILKKYYRTLIQRIKRYLPKN
jgi:hypothetical protein